MSATRSQALFLNLESLFILNLIKLIISYFRREYGRILAGNYFLVIYLYCSNRELLPRVSNINVTISSGGRVNHRKMIRLTW